MNTIELDPEDFNAKGLRKLLQGMKESSKPYGKRSKERQEKDAEDQDEDNDDLVNLHREKKGDSKPPKVSDDDLPEELEEDEEEDD